MRAAALLVAMLGACSGHATWRALAETEFTPAQVAQRQKVEAARDNLAQTLLGELSAALANGPAAALVVCSERAPVLAAQVAERHQVRIGRTSLSLRNPHNTPPAWAVDHLRSGPAAAAWFAGSRGEFGALLPIRLQPQCVQCHGEATALSAEVRAALAKLYPQDRATGFRAGDLRGYFWVEVPN
jgi:hypothetical protein